MARQAGKDEIIETVNNFSSLPPFKDKKKVIIIEEIQELSTKAKNSLLKTLEMPKKNVHFIFTSMENMASSGLTSRCEVFKFKPATTLEIMYYLKEIMDKEIVDGVSLWDRQDIPMEFKTEGLKAIADSCDGSYRAALHPVLHPMGIPPAAFPDSCSPKFWRSLVVPERKQGLLSARKQRLHPQVFLLPSEAVFSPVVFV